LQIDGQIAAIAKVNDLILVTANVSDYKEFSDIVIENRCEPKEKDAKLNLTQGAKASTTNLGAKAPTTNARRSKRLQTYSNQSYGLNGG
jgi:hypothetical protein